MRLTPTKSLVAVTERFNRPINRNLSLLLAFANRVEFNNEPMVKLSVFSRDFDRKPSQTRSDPRRRPEKLTLYDRSGTRRFPLRANPVSMPFSVTALPIAGSRPARKRLLLRDRRVPTADKHTVDPGEYRFAVRFASWVYLSGA